MTTRTELARLISLLIGMTLAGWNNGLDLETTSTDTRDGIIPDGDMATDGADSGKSAHISLPSVHSSPGYSENTTDLVSRPYNEDETSTPDLGTKKISAGSQDYVGLVTVPIALIVGCIGNGITLVAMVTPPFSRMSWSVTLASLAVADTIVLVATALNKDFVISLIGIDIRSINAAGCKIFHFIRRMGKIDSSWCVVLVCVERFIAICFPLRAKMICTRKNTIRIVLALLLFVIVYCALSVAPVGIDGSVCRQVINTPERKRSNQMYVIVASFLLGILPMTILLTLTPVICVILLKHAQKRRNLYVGHEDVNKYKKASTMLISIHVAYIILVMPAIIYKNIKFADSSLIAKTSLVKIIEQFTRVMEELVNHSINFFLYTAFNPLFRKRLSLLLSPSKSSSSVSTRPVCIETA